jgi:hypothetical protein
VRLLFGCHCRSVCRTIGTDERFLNSAEASSNDASASVCSGLQDLKGCRECELAAEVASAETEPEERWCCVSRESVSRCCVIWVCTRAKNVTFSKHHQAVVRAEFSTG